jgi:FkbM family methyltransferase
MARAFSVALRTPMALKLARLIRDLATLRRYRARRAARLPWWIRIPYLRNTLRHRALEHWPGGYVMRTDGRFVYVPAHVDVTAGHRLFKPATELPLVESLCQPGDCVLDVGANVGDWTLAMALRVGRRGKVLAFEPVPYLADTVRKTARINRQHWVEVLPLALSATDGAAEFSVERGNSGGSRLGRAQGDFTLTSVTTARLDTLLATRPDVDRIDLVKIDVEGAEADVLAGAERSLERFRPVLLVESGFETPEQRESIHGLLTGLGYDLVGADVPGGLVELAWPDYRKPGERLQSLGLCNLLFLPQ